MVSQISDSGISRLTQRELLQALYPGYITGFDRVMLGEMRRARERIVRHLAGCQTILDAGCDGGQTAGMLKAAGVPEVWGVDPSPYLLRHAARSFPTVRFVQGLAERLQFGAARFDGVVACFLLHELPPRLGAQAFREFYRVLRPGGRLALCEPAPIQLRRSYRQLLKRYGWRGFYFRILAELVHEPFVKAWHRQDVVGLLRRIGFEVVSDSQRMPMRHVFLAVKPATS